MKSKIKIAFVKFGGLAAGGTEKALQTIATHLPADKFEVDYFYCDAAPYIGSDYKHNDTDLHRKAYMENSNVRLIKFNVAYKDIRNPIHPWVDTNFWELFDEKRYHIVQAGRSGHSEYPFTQINETPQVDLVTLPGMAERKSNVFKTVHISKFQADTWVQAGGDPNKVEIIPLFDELPPLTTENFKESLLLQEKFVFGMHQRDNDEIFSPVPLMAYKRLEEQGLPVAFLLMGGSAKYDQQARELGLKHFQQLPHSGDKDQIHKFLETLDVYSHGRSDGETFSLAIAEAMYHGLPIISHIAPAMGHEETIGNAGHVAKHMDEYVNEMNRLLTDKDYYNVLSTNAKTRFINHLSLEANMAKWVSLYESCVSHKEKDNLSDEDFWGDMWVEN